MMNSRTLVTLTIMVVVLPVAVYFRVWDYYAINIPKWDDHALKQFLVDFIHAKGWIEKWDALSRQHNEHRILLTRLLTWADYSFFGQLNYKRLMLYGNLLFMGLLLLWSLILLKNNKPAFSIIPLAFLWPTLSHWENMYWGMASVQNFGVVTLAVASIYWSVRGRWVYFVLGMTAAALAAFSSGNGLLILPVIAGLLILRGKQKRFIIWILASAVVFYFYFAGYQQPTYNPQSKASFFEFLQGYMAFIGSFAEVFPVRDKRDICVVLGAILFLVSLSIIWAIVFRLIKKKQEHEYARVTDLFSLGVILFILGTAAIVVYSRAGFGIDTLITSRYKIYSFLLLATVYLFVVIPIRGSFLSPYVSGVALLTILLNIFAYHFYLVDAYNLRKFLTTSYFNQLYPKKDLVAQEDTSVAARLVEKPEVFFYQWLPFIRSADLTGKAGNALGAEEISRYTGVSYTNERLEVANETYSSQRLQDSGVYILLSSDKRYYVFPAYRRSNRNKKQLFLKQQYFAPGFLAQIATANSDEVAPGSYRLGLVLQKGDSTDIYMRRDTVVVRGGNGGSRIQTNW